MRLTPFEVQTIKSIIQKHDPNAKIYLFGSRVNDQARGGDIDLLTQAPKGRKI
ncbi:MAG: nucleotidyltransferase domain-containing protein [Gammaproteobacteria bacterium]|nr:nucleotidyltransferase domain-containing protein [Gammaproteobacteria bacterium]MBU1558692.1 nucleotidyltransferase domain-containing protein [Gammaproteobacteria bacterium]MBU1926743.1 nucleotidyltransferase domain-containing protein [Gammaproteobacteria bacterium]MBU2546453.1 nucleotidyltransferase domain-containing protein [Gammaproteobacteria bacterium]